MFPKPDRLPDRRPHPRAPASRERRRRSASAPLEAARFRVRDRREVAGARRASVDVASISGRLRSYEPRSRSGASDREFPTHRQVGADRQK